MVILRRISGFSGLLIALWTLLPISRATALPDLRDVTVTASGSDEPGAFCSDFALTKVHALRALRESGPITKETFLHNFEWLPCFVAAPRALYRAGFVGKCVLAETES